MLKLDTQYAKTKIHCFFVPFWVKWNRIRRKIILEVSLSVMNRFLFLVLCTYPNVLTSSATCVNVLIDRNNCGMVGNICNDSYRSCSGGVCSMAPAVQLYDPIIVWMGALNGSADFTYFDVTLPFNITLYNSTTDNVAVSTTGVSFFLCE